jgi:hypothetical protein
MSKFTFSENDQQVSKVCLEQLGEIIDKIPDFGASTNELEGTKNLTVIFIKTDLLKQIFGRFPVLKRMFNAK